MARIEQKIAQVNIIVLQVVNRTSTLKATLAWATKLKQRYKRLLKFIYTINVNDVMMEEKVKEEQ